MQITKDNLTIIILTIKSENIIDNCLNSIDSDINKIIIENSSNKDFVKNISTKYKNIQCFATGKNLGMGAGNNFGIKKSKTRYVMILNPDTVLKKDTLNEIFKASKNLDFSIISPICDNKEYPNYKVKNKNFNNENNLFEVDSVDGYAMILDKTKFNNIFFDEKIFMYLENDDLCLRMKKKGEKIFINKNSKISHLGAKAVNEIYYDQIEYSRNWHWNWSRFYFKKKHKGYLYAFFSCLPLLVKSIMKCSFYFLLNQKSKYNIYKFRVLGLFNSFINRSSWYRPRLD